MKEVDWLEYSAGGVPSGQIFRMTLNDLIKILKSSPDTGNINRLNELCLIGLASYFEAFCKDHFASIINIIPELVENLSKSGQDITIDSSRVLLYRTEITHKIGFMVSEKYDFGSAKKINALYKALINISPFSKNDIKKYEAFLKDRNLFVHHGGTYTLSYLKQSKVQNENDKDKAYWDSLTLDSVYMNEKISFIEGIALKLLTSSTHAVNQFVEESKLIINKEQQKAIDAFLWWD